jgi:hypothetical protein
MRSRSSSPELVGTAAQCALDVLAQRSSLPASARTPAHGEESTHEEMAGAAPARGERSGSPRWIAARERRRHQWIDPWKAKSA